MGNYNTTILNLYQCWYVPNCQGKLPNQPPYHQGSRGYFEHGPWATTADVNITNDNFCGRNRAKVRYDLREHYPNVIKFDHDDS